MKDTAFLESKLPHLKGECVKPVEYSLHAELRAIWLQYNWIKCVKSVAGIPLVSSLFVALKMDDFCGTALS